MTELSDHLLERILERLGLESRPAVDLDGLREIYSSWCREVPFDNIRKLIAVRRGDPGPLPGDRPSEFFDAWLRHGTGGTCWAGNGALCELLSSLGFAARRGVATMVVAPDLPPNHGTVTVELDSGRYLVDASILFVEPLRVVEGRDTVIDHPAWGVRGHWLDHRYAIRWSGLRLADPIDCRIDDWSVDAERFRDQHEETREWSPFNYELTYSRITADGRLGIAQGRRIFTNRRGEQLVETIADRVALLTDELGVSEELARQLPEDVPTPPPPGSLTAGELDGAEPR